MTILLVDTYNTGHHKIYLKNIISKINGKDIKLICLLPFEFESSKSVFLSFPRKTSNLQFFIDRKKWLHELAKISSKEQPDIIHFLYGDSIYQLGGMGLKELLRQTKKLVITQHLLPKGFMRKMLFKRTIKHFDAIVVHTEEARNFTRKLLTDQNKVSLIDYPASHITDMDKQEAEDCLDIKSEAPILLSLGATRYDKGLDILLEALKRVKEKYHLIITGKEAYFNKFFIEEKIKKLVGKVTIRLNTISNEEFGWFVDAADCIVIPYRKMFDGASGPMTEAVWRKKPVIGPNHGSLGDLITKYKLGYTFETENIESLAKTISYYLRNPFSFIWTKCAEEYRKRLDPDVFAEKYLDLYKSLLNNKEVY